MTLEKPQLQMIYNALPGHAQVCKGCDNKTFNFGCTVQNLGEFADEQGRSDLETVNQNLEQKLPRIPDGCPIKDALQLRGQVFWEK